MTTTHARSDAFTFSSPTTLATRGRRLRSTGAVLAGLLTTIVVTTAVDMTLHASGVFPPMAQRMSDALFVLALAYRIPLNMAGCYIAARLAPFAPFRHALALGALGIVLATIGAAAMWDAGPAWYSLANIAVAMPCAWLAGRLAQPTRARER